MDIALVIIGLLLVSVALHDIFRTLFHPEAHGAMSDWIAHAVWRIAGPIADRTFIAITIAGPLAMLTIIAIWTALIVIGCALVYETQVHGGFALAQGLDPAQHRHFLDAFNISFGSMITLSGDFNPHSGWVRLLMEIEAVLGFGVLTASVSWLLSLYPVLETRRSLAETLNSLRDAEISTGIPATALPAGEAQPLLMGLASQFIQLRNEMSQFPIAYYFHSGEDRTSTARIMPYARALAERAAASDRPATVRLAGAQLHVALHSYLCFIAANYLRLDSEDDEQMILAYAADQRRKLVDIVEQPQPRAA